MRKYGDSWKLIPPSVPELYPNMCNNSNTKWVNIKNKLAKKNNEITQLWMCGPKNREIAHQNGIFSWKDPNCNANNLGITGPITSSTLDTIIEVNQSSELEYLHTNNNNLSIIDERS